MSDCADIKQQLDGSVELRTQIVQELQQPGLPPAERGRLIRELKDVNAEIARLKKAYDSCLNPPPPQPDLKAVKFVLPRANGRMSMAGIIRNDGDGPAHGPFKVILGATYLDTSRVRVVQIPSSVTIEGFGHEYQTPEAIEDIPLLNVDEDPRFVYRFDMLVDSDFEVTEALDANNSLSVIYRLHL